MNNLANAIRDAAAPLSFLPRPELLLMPNVPKPLHGVAPRVILGQTWWNKTRKEAEARTGGYCLACSVYKKAAQGPRRLEGHEVYKIDYQRGYAVYVETVAICHFCHCYIHDGRLAALLVKGEVTLQKFEAILEHGDRVLANAGLSKPRDWRIGMKRGQLVIVRKPAALVSMKIAEWSKWRMIINGKPYPPKFKTYQAWLRGHGYEEE